MRLEKETVGQEEAVLQELILKLINKNNRVTKKQITKEASVSKKLLRDR